MLYSEWYSWVSLLCSSSDSVNSCRSLSQALFLSSSWCFLSGLCHSGKSTPMSLTLVMWLVFSAVFWHTVCHLSVYLKVWQLRHVLLSIVEAAPVNRFTRLSSYRWYVCIHNAVWPNILRHVLLGDMWTGVCCHPARRAEDWWGRVCLLSYLISVFFQRATVAAFIGILLYVISYLPFIILVSINSPSNRWQQSVAVSNNSSSTAQLLTTGMCNVYEWDGSAFASTENVR